MQGQAVFKGTSSKGNQRSGAEPLIFMAVLSHVWGAIQEWCMKASQPPQLPLM